MVLKDAAKVACLGLVYVLLVVNYWRNPAPRSLRGLAVPDFAVAWLRERPLCRTVSQACGASEACGEASTVPPRCAAAARRGIGLASAKCYAELFAIEAAPEDAALDRVVAARACLRRSYRSAFSREGLPAPRLEVPRDWTPTR